MNISPINTNQNFQGSVIVKNTISLQQRYLFNLHRPALEKMMKDLPFDLFVEQSKSKKTITLSTNVEGASAYIIRKNEQDYEVTAGYAIADAKKHSEIYKKQVKADEIFEYVKASMINVLLGKFNYAREFDKELAKRAVKDFDIYKAVTNFKIINLPEEANKILFKNTIKYKLYRAFTSKTTEEKELYKMNKKYLKDMKAQNKKIEPQIIDFSKIYGFYR